MRENLSRMQKQLASEYKGIQDEYTECLVKFKVSVFFVVASQRHEPDVLKLCNHRLAKWRMQILRNTARL